MSTTIQKQPLALYPDSSVTKQKSAMPVDTPAENKADSTLSSHDRYKSSLPKRLSTGDRIYNGFAGTMMFGSALGGVAWGLTSKVPMALLLGSVGGLVGFVGTNQLMYTENPAERIEKAKVVSGIITLGVGAAVGLATKNIAVGGIVGAATGAGTFLGVKSMIHAYKTEGLID